MNAAAALKALRKRRPTLRVLTDEGARYAASFDNLRYAQKPSAVLKPDEEADIAAILEVANAHGQPVTTRGAGSATTGAATPVVGGWVVDFSDWKSLHIDALARMAYVQPGVTIAALDSAANTQGLRYAPDPGSRKHASIGGSIATNAGGLRGAKYGVTRDYVLSLEGFLPNGKFVRWGANLRKFSVGYNMRDLWIGSEGALGIITGAVLRLLPQPEAQLTALAAFADADAAIDCVHDLLGRRYNPSVLEFLDEQTVACTVNLWRRKRPEALAAIPEAIRPQLLAAAAPAVLLIELEDEARALDGQRAALERALAGHTQAYAFAETGAHAETLWTLRRSCSQAMFELAPRKLNEDVVVPIEAQKALLGYTRQLQRETGFHTPTFGHAADGNFHVHILFDPEAAGAAERAHRAVHSLMEKVVSLGGAISGEHGVGLAKSEFLGLQYGAAELEAMRAIKRALDPNNILNPHLMWEPTNVANLPRETVRLPWDH